MADAFEKIKMMASPKSSTKVVPNSYGLLRHHQDHDELQLTEAHKEIKKKGVLLDESKKDMQMLQSPQSFLSRRTRHSSKQMMK